MGGRWRIEGDPDVAPPSPPLLPSAAGSAPMRQSFTVTTEPQGAGGVVVVHVSEAEHVTFSFPSLDALRAFTLALLLCGGVEVDAD